MSLFLSLISAAVMAQSPNPVTECVAGERVMAISDQGGHLPSTVMGPATPGECLIQIDEMLPLGSVPAPYSLLVRGLNPAAPDPRAIQLGLIPTLDGAQQDELYALARDTHANARIWVSRFDVTVQDDLIVTRVCNPDWQSRLCQKVNQQFHASVSSNNARLDERNRVMGEQARASSSEPVNSGYYQSGQYSRDVAASQGGYTAPSAPVTGAPVVVQSETEIRREQAQCRAGSGPC